MPEPARIALRLLGLLLLLAGLACAVLLIWPGPGEIAEAMGATCSSDRRSSRACDSWDAADLLWTGCWVSLLAGGVLRLVTRPNGRGPRTLDLRRFR